MNDISGFLSSVDLASAVKLALVFAAVSLILGFVGHFAFGKRSGLNHAVSSAIGILFIYVVTVVILTVGGELARFQTFLTPLPFVSIQEEQLVLFQLPGADFPGICSQVLSMLILAFLVNLIDTALPRGEKPLTWFGLRLATVVLSILAHFLVTGLLTQYLPQGFMTYAPMILLLVLLIMLAVGSLRFLVGAAIAAVNPIIGALYTFFFANIVGKQLSKATLTTALLTALVYAGNHFGINAISISPQALVAYIPFLALLTGLWYVVNAIL